MGEEGEERSREEKAITKSCRLFRMIYMISVGMQRLCDSSSMRLCPYTSDFA